MAIPVKKIALHTATAVLALDSVVVPILSGTGQSIHQMVFDGPMPPTEWYVMIAENVGMLGCNYLAMPDTWRHIPGRLREGPEYWSRIDKE